jgi:hypothetical protein
MADKPIVNLRLPLYSLVLKDGKLTIGAGKALLWTSQPRVLAALEVFKDLCGNFAIIDTRDSLRLFVAKAQERGLTHATVDMERGENERVVVVPLDQLVETVGGNPEAN